MYKKKNTWHNKQVKKKCQCAGVPQLPACGGGGGDGGSGDLPDLKKKSSSIFLVDQSSRGREGPREGEASRRKEEEEGIVE